MLENRTTRAQLVERGLDKDKGLEPLTESPIKISSQGRETMNLRRG